ncbi:hypothetical protein Csp2054_05035 [Curtobacterium sp. 'Ferrero']|uniref:C40 family peptidase n=1 Tax=Curtobacterium sp. 'Ferrero' TaxID=2033654 RepID=UPI000BD2804F|nr:NlpC/P60 family protein [Curtobacterium sp. 'Ferrero']PCN48932.1 hypothetical protein Csp2054_05035 [Curtobacterium sp. 'Ferrero']
MKQSARTLACTAVVAVAGIGLSLALAVPAQATPSAPSWDDVRAAKADAAEAQSTADELTTRLQDLQDAADAAGVREMQAGQSYAMAASQQQEAQATLDALDGQAKRAERQAKASAGQVASLVVELARTGGGDLSTSMLVDAKDSKDLLYRVGTMAQLSGHSATVLAAAQADQNTVDSIADQQRAATKALADATTTTKRKLDEANAIAASAQARVTREQAQQGEVLQQLAYLKGTSVATETAYWNAEQAKQAAAALPVVSTTTGSGSTSGAASGGTTTSPSSGGGTTTSPSSGGGTTTSPSSGGSTTTSPSNGGGTTTTQPSTSPSTPSRPSPSTPSQPAPKPSPAPTPKPTPAPSTPSRAAGAIAFARAQLGDPYVWGAAGPNSWDCSGLVMMAYNSQGVATGGHNVVWQYNYFASIGRLVPLSQRQPGDILFYSSNGTASGGYHDSIYTGNGQMIEAARPGVGVVERAVWLPNQLLPYVARPTGSL